ncbi:MAG: hypothetical protein RLZZ241_1145 [Bacteroidota bacterium]|jgi:putative phosphoesterase
MTRILLLSDTHGHLDDRILKYAQEADEIWHAGDIGSWSVAETLQQIKPFRAVYGNIDDAEIRSEFPLDSRFLCEQVPVWITHIGGYPKRYNERVRKELGNAPCRLFICGHSHILKVMHDSDFNLLHMNPGAAGVSGFHAVRTMLRFVVDGSQIKDLEVIELGKRG